MSCKVLYVLRFSIVKKDLIMAISCYRQLFPDFCLWQPQFNHGTLHMVFMVRQDIGTDFSLSNSMSPLTFHHCSMLAHWHYSILSFVEVGNVIKKSLILFQMLKTWNIDVDSVENVEVLCLSLFDRIHHIQWYAVECSISHLIWMLCLLVFSFAFIFLCSFCLWMI